MLGFVDYWNWAFSDGVGRGCESVRKKYFWLYIYPYSGCLDMFDSMVMS